MGRNVVAILNRFGLSLFAGKNKTQLVPGEDFVEAGQSWNLVGQKRDKHQRFQRPHVERAGLERWLAVAAEENGFKRNSDGA